MDIAGRHILPVFVPVSMYGPPAFPNQGAAKFSKFVMGEIIIGLVTGAVVACVIAWRVKWFHLGKYVLLIGVLGGGICGGIYTRLGLAGESPILNGLVSGSIGGLALLVIVRLFLAVLGWNPELSAQTTEQSG